VTASFGIAHTYDHGYDLAALSRAVDSAIDSVKHQGGNNVTTAIVPQ
jgi:GGDEF domain-containing protein